MMNNQYYYFIRGYDRIFPMCEYVCDGQQGQYTELSQVQASFYQIHPDAKAHEVIQGYMDVDAPKANIPIAEYKLQKVRELDELSLNTAGKLSPAYKRENVAISLELLTLKKTDPTISQVPLYTNSQCKEIITHANRIAEMCRNERYRILSLIEAAKTIEEVDVAFNNNNYFKIK